MFEVYITSDYWYTLLTDALLILFPLRVLEVLWLPLPSRKPFDPLCHVYESVSINPNLLVHPSHPNLLKSCLKWNSVNLLSINESISASFWGSIVSIPYDAYLSQSKLLHSVCDHG